MLLQFQELWRPGWEMTTDSHPQPWILRTDFRATEKVCLMNLWRRLTHRNLIKREIKLQSNTYTGLSGIFFCDSCFCLWTLCLNQFSKSEPLWFLNTQVPRSDLRIVVECFLCVPDFGFCLKICFWSVTGLKIASSIIFLLSPSLNQIVSHHSFADRFWLLIALSMWWFITLN